ncbi:Six-hairpin glycosidase [Fusarium agapanthi]|uniref:Six-hairpin glycosidase n=1 Tax=Fusarium agapanthi TaxID=1803897 RepID=A0A9P5B4D5_9HYPO|nr:Six-hairpin glycosidase [Fusarium agapanthi]
MRYSSLTPLIHIASSILSVFGTEITMSNRRELVKFKFDALPPGAVSPTGWLKDQLQLSADGLAGYLFEFYRYVSRSTWLGGDWEYSELNEASSYWFNYIVPSAWSLDDAKLKSQAKAYLDYVLNHQAEDGWLGPETTRQTRGLWARSLLLFGLTQYAEADPSARDLIVDSMHKFLKLTHSILRSNFTGLTQDENQGDHFDPFGFRLSRTHELPIYFMWLYENHPRDAGDIILETIELMFDGGRKGGRDWTEFFFEGVFPKGGTGTFETSSFTHGVNLAQGLRYLTVLYRLTGNDSLVQQTKMAVDMTAKYQGSELCMAVESIFSYAFLYRFHGVNSYADKAELAAFNPFPAAMSPGWWSHHPAAQSTTLKRTQIRIPGWTTPEANIEMNGGRSKRVTPDDSGLHHATILPGSTTLTLKLPMEVRIEMRNSSASISYGPLLYTFDIPYTETHHQPLNWTDRKPLADEEVHPRSHDYVLEPTEPWQYAIDPDSIVVKTSTLSIENLPNPIFSRDAPPVFLTVDAWKIAWPTDEDTAAWPPIDPVVDKDKKEKIKLVPFGSAKLHIAQFPVSKPQ